MIIRFRCKDGNYRITANPNDEFSVIINEIGKQIPNADLSSLKISDKPTAGTEQSASELSHRLVGDLNMKHGDLYFLTYNDKQQQQQQQQQEQRGDAKLISSQRLSGKTVTEEELPPQEQQQKSLVPTHQDPVDDYLDTQSGQIQRKRDPRMCRHGEMGRCEFCLPLEPYDENYLKENNIKHMSFHAYLRKVNAATNKPENKSSFIPPLTPPDYHVKVPCPSGHLPYPEGICTKCQPSTITLTQQQFRMVDHVEFADFQIVNQFIQYWRNTATQRIGILYGHYEPYSETPLGIKAVVEAIYEQPQIDEIDGISLILPFEKQKEIDKVAEKCGLKPVGIIFTDLTDSGKGDGSVICKRHAKSYFLSSLEVYFAAIMQSKYPNASKWSQNGYYSSKFVTCIVSGNEKGEIEVESYQVSAVAEAMVKADFLQPSTHANLMLIKPSTNKRYVPDIKYRKLNEYNATILQDAKDGFPVDYLLVKLTHGFPSNPNPIFTSKISFPIENRQSIGVVQDLKAVSNQIGVIGNKDEDRSIDSLSDFHFITYINGLEILSNNEMTILAKAAISHDANDSFKLLDCHGWQTLLTILRETS